ncbi:hypothetical protein B0H17DRAFT_1131420 [Mycena rosella]|uniref:Uncharacterized protein n=1 Tax=Mycena rosella TaxID=1033263 RepID=A0AAD7DNE5_MYCRO|nr:hypothetical protein B0H17DRAFT_1131420 [Mycena rosella]
MQKQLSLQLIHVPKVLQFINGKRSNGGSKALNLSCNNMWAGDGRNKTIDHTARWLSVKGISGGSKALNWILNITGTLMQDIGFRIRTSDGFSKCPGKGGEEQKYISASLPGRAAAITPK